MDEILDLLNQLEDSFPDTSPKKLKVKLIKSLTFASSDVAKLIKRQDFEGVENRIKQLHDEQMKIRANFVVDQFPSAGFHYKQNEDLEGLQRTSV